MSFANNTPYSALDVPHQDPDGADIVVAIVKATFDVQANGALVRSERPRPVRINDEMYDTESAESSVRLPTDVCAAKRGTDVVVVGEAWSPKPVDHLDVSTKVRDRLIPLRVHGPRVFYRGVGDVAIGPASTFERMPVVYERAYGGVADEGWTVEPRNRAGVGVGKNKKDLIDRPAPQIEHPGRPHRSAGDDHPPVGFGAIRAHWSPRLELHGTFDEAWQATRMPLMPSDFDVRANNCAHPTLWFETPLRGGDPVAVTGMCPEGVLAFAVPQVPVMVVARSDVSGRREFPLEIDTMLIVPAERCVEVTMRAAVPLGRGRDVLRELQVELYG